MSALAKILIQDTPIDWDRYVLTDADTQRFVDPRSLVTSISDVIHGRGARNGATLPWPDTHGFVRLPGGHLSMWAGINFHGKSAMLKQFAIHLANSGHKVCAAFLEELPEESMADVAQLSLPDVDLRDSDEYIDIACNWASGKLWLYNQTRMMEPHRVLALIAYAAKEKGCTHFILDSLMRTGIAQDDYEGQRVFANQLTNYAMMLNIHIHLVHHIVKVDELQVPGRESIRGTGALMDQAHHIFIVWRDTNEDKLPDAPDGLLIVAKNRGIRPLNWRGKLQMFIHKQSGQFLRARWDKPMIFIGEIG